MSTFLRKQGGKLRKGVAEEPGSKRTKTDVSGKEGEHKNHRKKYHTGPIVAELRSMDRKLRSQDKKPKMEEAVSSKPQRKTPKKTNNKRKRSTNEEDEESEELEIEIVETKRIKGRDCALVHFIGYAHSEDEWKPLSEIHSEETDSERPTEKGGKRKKGAAKEEMEQVKRPKGKTSKSKKKGDEEEAKEEQKPARPGRKKRGTSTRKPTKKRRTE